jgi:hypothetical protein
VMSFFQDRVPWAIYLGPVLNCNPPISASWVARIAGLSHWCPAHVSPFRKQVNKMEFFTSLWESRGWIWGENAKDWADAFQWMLGIPGSLVLRDFPSTYAGKFGLGIFKCPGDDFQFLRLLCHTSLVSACFSVSLLKVSTTLCLLDITHQHVCMYSLHVTEFRWGLEALKSLVQKHKQSVDFIHMYVYIMLY